MFAMQLKKLTEREVSPINTISPPPASTHLRGVDVHGVEGVDGDQDVPHTCVDLVLGIAGLQVVRHCVLEVTGVNKRWISHLSLVSHSLIHPSVLSLLFPCRL